MAGWPLTQKGRHCGSNCKQNLARYLLVLRKHHWLLPVLFGDSCPGGYFIYPWAEGFNRLSHNGQRAARLDWWPRCQALRTAVCDGLWMGLACRHPCIVQSGNLGHSTAVNHRSFCGHLHYSWDWHRYFRLCGECIVYLPIHIKHKQAALVGNRGRLAHTWQFLQQARCNMLAC